MLTREENELLTRTGPGTAMGTLLRRRLMSEARALRDRGAPPPAANPESFCVRSASMLLPPDASWIEGARARVVVKPGGQLTLA